MRAPFKVTFHLLGSVSLMNWVEEKSDFLPKCVYFVKLAITSSLLWHSIFRVPCGSLTDPFVSVLCKYFCTLTYPIFFSHFINLWFCKELELMLNDCHFAEAKINPVLWQAYLTTRQSRHVVNGKCSCIIAYNVECLVTYDRVMK